MIGPVFVCEITSTGTIKILDGDDKPETEEGIITKTTFWEWLENHAEPDKTYWLLEYITSPVHVKELKTRKLEELSLFILEERN